MRKMVLSVMSMALLALAGCGSSTSSPTEDGTASASSTAATNTATSVSGTITVRGAIQPSPDAQLVINLVDVSPAAAGSAPVASKTVASGATFPYSFQLDFKPGDIKSSDMYVVKVTLTDGARHYSMPIQAPVLTQGNKNQASIELLAEQTPAEKDQADFDALIKQIGGMKVSTGTKLEDNASRGWQVFRQDGEVKVIRELVDYGDKGFTSTDFAYKNGAPWAAAQQKKANKDAPTSSISRASWTENGMLVLHQQQIGDKTADLDSDTANSLRQQALAIYNLAGGNKKK
ncbi:MULTISPECIES: YbaY family lipoprotein [Rhodanobacter]|uniref:YbaY family lipoprotein n=1 Tax=Rhodanobacter hydrolyticus TaxID=2250595 RepID=A0ABW8J9K1_9GAMM|nr:YbaY family lipoprotein [Rhodanobacter sp. 7MK24]MBD8882186.1 YbaY family lipoprotein [Rhodanobacter sp. 7MK24]